MPQYKLSDEQFLPLWKQWASQKTPANMTKLLDGIRPILAYGIAYYAGDLGATPLTLAQARAIAVDAIKKYDPSRGSFVSYMLLNLQRLQRRAAELRQIIRQPERVAMAQMQLAEATKRLSDRLGREPTAADLADELGMSLKMVERIRKQAQAVPEASFADLPEARPLGTEEQPAMELLEYAYIDADPKDKLIMEHHFGLHGAQRLSNTAIAKKLKVSPAAVTQRLDRIYKKIPEWQSLLSG